MFHGCDSFEYEHVATWPLPDEESVVALFVRSHNWWSDASDDEVYDTSDDEVYDASDDEVDGEMNDEMNDEEDDEVEDEEMP
jgi:hypothetical protein